MKVQTEFEVDFDTRVVTLKILREFDVAPISVKVPFAVLKGVVGGIVSTEAEIEKAAMRQGRPQLVVAETIPTEVPHGT